MNAEEVRRAAQARADEIDDALVEGRKKRGVPVGALGRGWSAFDDANPGTLVLAALEGDVRPLAKAWEAERHRRTDLRAGIIAELARRSADERAHMRLLAAANGLVTEAIDLAEPSAEPPPEVGTGWYLNTVSLEEREPFQPAERWCRVRVVDAQTSGDGHGRYKVDVLEGPAAGRTVAVPRASLRSTDEVLGTDRLLSEQHEAALRSYERGDGGAVAARREARGWLKLVERAAQPLATAREVQLFHSALAEQAKQDREGHRRVVPEGLVERELGLAHEARDRAAELLLELQRHVVELEQELRRASDFDEGERIVRWNMAGDGGGRGVRRAMLREEPTDGPALRADRTLLAKAKSIEAEAVGREVNGPTPEERRKAEREVLETTGRPVHCDTPPLPPPEPVEPQAARPDSPRGRTLVALLAGLTSPRSQSTEPVASAAQPTPPTRDTHADEGRVAALAAPLVATRDPAPGTEQPSPHDLVSGAVGGAWSSSRAAVRCETCGETWPRDPALEVPCPDCRAKVGAWCKRPSGHKAMSLHRSRDAAAVAAGVLKPCPAAPQPPAPTPSAPRSSRASSVPPPLIVCDICRNRRPRAEGADQDICKVCLHGERVKAGIEQPSPLPELDPELRSLREMLTFDRWVPPGRVPTNEEMEAARFALWNAREAHEKHATPKTARALDDAERYYRRLFDTNKAVADRIEADQQRRNAKARREARRGRIMRFVTGGDT